MSTASPNTLKPNGLSPYRNANGSPWNGGGNVYHVPATYATKIAIGDLVKSVATSDANGVTDIVIATGATDFVRGVVVGWLPAGPGGNLSLVGAPLALENITPAVSTDKYFLVCDDPGVIFKAQLDAATTNGTVALSTLLTKNVQTNAASYDAQNRSTTSLASGSIAATLTTTLKLRGLVVGPENNNVLVSDTNGQGAWVQCSINLHELAGGVGSTGV